jgi:hypothetical protein
MRAQPVLSLPKGSARTVFLQSPCHSGQKQHQAPLFVSIFRRSFSYFLPRAHNACVGCVRHLPLNSADRCAARRDGVYQLRGFPPDIRRRLMSHRYRNTVSALGRVLTGLLTLTLHVVVRDAAALTFTVNTLADSTSGNTSTGSLRDGLNAVNAATDLANTITFQPGLSGSILLTAPLPLVLNNIVIDATGATIAIDGASTYRIFFVGVDAATATSLQALFPTSPLSQGSALAVTLRI